MDLFENFCRKQSFLGERTLVCLVIFEYYTFLFYDWRNLLTRCSYLCECREVFLYAIKKVSTKYNFRLYALCIMSNHVHYLIEPLQDRRFTENYALPQLVHSYVFQQNVKTYGAFLGKTILLLWVSFLR